MIAVGATPSVSAATKKTKMTKMNLRPIVRPVAPSASAMTCPQVKTPAADEARQWIFLKRSFFRISFAPQDLLRRSTTLLRRHVPKQVAKWLPIHVGGRLADESLAQIRSRRIVTELNHRIDTSCCRSKSASRSQPGKQRTERAVVVVELRRADALLKLECIKVVCSGSRLRGTATVRLRNTAAVRVGVIATCRLRKLNVQRRDGIGGLRLRSEALESVEVS